MDEVTITKVDKNQKQESNTSSTSNHDKKSDKFSLTEWKEKVLADMKTEFNKNVEESDDSLPSLEFGEVMISKARKTVSKPSDGSPKLNFPELKVSKAKKSFIKSSPVADSDEVNVQLPASASCEKSSESGTLPLGKLLKRIKESEGEKTDCSNSSHKSGMSSSEKAQIRVRDDLLGVSIKMEKAASDDEMPVLSTQNLQRFEEEQIQVKNERDRSPPQLRSLLEKKHDSDASSDTSDARRRSLRLCQAKDETHGDVDKKLVIKVEQLESTSSKTPSSSKTVKKDTDSVMSSLRTGAKILNKYKKTLTRSRSAAEFFTKTGKRKKKPFKGLNYSFGYRKKKKKTLPVMDKPKSEEEEEEDSNLTIPSLDKEEDEDQGFEEDTVPIEEEEDHEDNPLKASTHPKQDDDLDVSEEIDVHLLPDPPKPDTAPDDTNQKILDERIVGSVALGVKQRRSSLLKRKLEGEDSDSSVSGGFHGTCCAAPAKKTPSTEETAIPDAKEAALPEQGWHVAQFARDLVLCQCTKGTAYQVGLDDREGLYCQALDCLDGRIIGCCNIITKFEYVRVGVRIPYTLLCDMHAHRMKIHNCCPGCGLFVTQGRYLQCRATDGESHYFHKKCRLFVNDEPL